MIELGDANSSPFEAHFSFVTSDISHTVFERGDDAVASFCRPKPRSEPISIESAKDWLDYED